MIHIDHETQTIKPLDAEGDSYFGLVVGSNGSATICRRELYTPAGYTWVRFNGRPAVGITLIPSADSDSTPSPWEGK